jgi:hypothetical protein
MKIHYTKPIHFILPNYSHNEDYGLFIRYFAINMRYCISETE